MSSRVRLLRRLSAAALLLAVVVVVLVLSLSGGPSRPGHEYVLALGDSLAQGVQAAPDGASVETDQGYVDDLYTHYRSALAGLQLVDLACPGDTTTSLMTGDGNADGAQNYHCDRQGGSQLRAALSFLAAHRGQVRLVTLDIGANDILGCFSSAVLEAGAATERRCFTDGLRTVQTNLPKLLAALRADLPAGTRVVGGTLYDPYLAAALYPGGQLLSLAEASLRVVDALNAEITAADTRAGVATAAVAAAFASGVTAERQDPALHHREPLELERICSWTWACTAAPRGPNIHANATGYAVIARAYEAAAGPRL